MNKEQLIKETEAILKLVEKDSRIGNYLEEIKKLLEIIKC
jgi:hypothetical protein